MNHRHIYYTFILKEYLNRIFDSYYPKEIIMVIVMMNYGNLNVICSGSSTIIRDTRSAYVWKHMNKKFSDVKLFCEGTNFIVRLTHSGELLVGNVPCKINLSFNHKQIKSICCTTYRIVILTTIGTCYEWECSTDGNDNLLIPEFIIFTKLDLEEINTISSGKSHIIAVGKNGDTYGWGLNTFNQLGLGYGYHIVNEPIKLDMKFITVSCGETFSCGISLGHKLYYWGCNFDAFDGIYEDTTPYQMSDLDVVAVSCGRLHVIVLTFDGKIYAWGNNQQGQLGLGDYQSRVEFCQIQICELPDLIKSSVHLKDEPIKSIYSGPYHNVVISMYEKVYIWGQYENNKPEELIF